MIFLKMGKKKLLFKDRRIIAIFNVMEARKQEGSSYITAEPYAHKHDVWQRGQ